MRRAILCMLLAAGCADQDEPVATTSLALGNECDYITCGRNTKDVGNGFVDQVFFDGTPNDRGQRFLSWKTSEGVDIAPALFGQFLLGYIDGEWRTGAALVGSTITLEDPDGKRLRLRFMEAAVVTLPSGVSVWTYRMYKFTSAWKPLCSLFSHTDDPIARFALIGTKELVHEDGKYVTPSSGKLTFGCPSSATGKLLSYGALRTTAAASQIPTTDVMTASLRALTLSPIGEASYTKAGVIVLFSVISTGVKNNNELQAGGVEGFWDQHGAICIDGLRHNDAQLAWALWSETHIPRCSEVDLSRFQVMVRTYQPFGDFPAYPPSPPMFAVVAPEPP